MHNGERSFLPILVLSPLANSSQLFAEYDLLRFRKQIKGFAFARAPLHTVAKYAYSKLNNWDEKSGHRIKPIRLQWL